MNLRKFLEDNISPSPLPDNQAFRRTLMWRGQHGDPDTNGNLVDLVIRAAAEARSSALEALDDRVPSDKHRRWPGEHYRMLAALIKLLQPRQVIEFGTFQGLSSLAMLHNLPDSGSIATFDLIPYNKIDGTLLKADDFTGGRLVQHYDNIAEPAGAEKHRALIESADFLFLDGPKDGTTEPRLVEILNGMKFLNPPIVVFDDIHNFKMLALWDELPYPKFDMTSFGHWTGTGIVRWENS